MRKGRRKPHGKPHQAMYADTVRIQVYTPLIGGRLFIMMYDRIPGFERPCSVTLSAYILHKKSKPHQVMYAVGIQVHTP